MTLPYDPTTLPRELCRHYISASSKDEQAMLDALGLKTYEELFSHIPAELRHEGMKHFPEEMDYHELAAHLEAIAAMNKPNQASFLSDGLSVHSPSSMPDFICKLRGLVTAYTPYQPERSQGTLATHWIYQCAVATLTGFEAVNASMYDRSSALFEALLTACRLFRNKRNTAIVAASIYPGDREVLETLAIETDLHIIFADIDPATGSTDFAKLKQLCEQAGTDLAVLAFPQTNALGVLEPVHAWADLAEDLGVKSVAIVDLLKLGKGGLIAPSVFGKKGTHMFVSEGLNLATGPTFGGPGLGVFGIRIDESNKNDIRSTPGRFVGKAVDKQGRECWILVLSSREQHIRRERATSNICSNQAFIATLAGASLLERGDVGLASIAKASLDNCKKAMSSLLSLDGVELAFPNSTMFNECSLKLDRPVAPLIAKANEENLSIGVDITGRFNLNQPMLLIAFNESHGQKELAQLVQFFEKHFKKNQTVPYFIQLPENERRQNDAGLLNESPETLQAYYKSLDAQNVSPDNTLYPLGSCTMKYNPYLNEYGAGLAGFVDIHPEVPEENAQGSLRILYETQELFKRITGLSGVTTQPLAGAQGELTGIKLFQAYHRDRGRKDRDIILIPDSAHGTNPATAAMAGFISSSGRKMAKDAGIVLIKSDSNGKMDMEHLKKLVTQYNTRIAGVMVTNPNTSGIFENRFHEMAEIIHSLDALVYMDGANMNAIAGWVDLGKLGVDAVHNNTHKTWSIPHGGGGPGDAFVAVSEKLLDYLPGVQVVKNGDLYSCKKAPKSIGSFHRHFGNFGHKIRSYAYLCRLGRDGVKHMSAMAVLSARYLYHRLKKSYPILPVGSENEPRMHEFILTLPKELFNQIIAVGVPKAEVISRVGKLFLDFGFHAPTVAFPEVYGIMIEPTESYTLAELDRFASAVESILELLKTTPQVLLSVPHFTPIDRVEDVQANRQLVLSEKLSQLPTVCPNRVLPAELGLMPLSDIVALIVQAHKNSV